MYQQPQQIRMESAEPYSLTPHLQTAPMTKRECLICLRFLPTRKADREDYKTNEENFNKILDIFKVNLTPFSWNFHVEGYPFCLNCSQKMSEVIQLQQKLVELQNDIYKQITEIQAKLRESEVTKTTGPNDVRSIIFRGQILKNCPPPPQQSGFGLAGTTSSLSMSVLTHQSNINTTPLQTPTKSVQSSSQGYSQLCQSTGVLPSSQAPDQSFVVVGFDLENLIAQKGSEVHNDEVAAIETVYDDDDYFQNDNNDENDFNDSVNSSESDDDYPKPKKTKIKPTILKRSRTGSRRKIVGLTLSKPKKRSSPSKRKPRGKSSPKRKRSSWTSREGNRVYVRPEGVKPQYVKRICTPIREDAFGRMVLEGIPIKTIPGGYECGECGSKFLEVEKKNSRWNVANHIRGIHLDLYRCSECDLSFARSDMLSLHNRRVHIDGVKECQICGKPLASKSMAWHLWLHKNAEEKTAAEAAGLKPKNNRANKHMCGHCGKLLSSATTLKYHEQLHANAAAAAANPLCCQYCDKSFPNEVRLKNHERRMHTSVREKKYQCPTCNFRAYKKGDIEQHKISHLKKQEKPYECSICAKRFGSKRLTRGHEARVHKDGDTDPAKYKYPCEVCGQRFPEKSCLPGHMRYHPEERSEMQKARQRLKLIPMSAEPLLITGNVEDDESQEEMPDTDRTAGGINESQLLPSRENTEELLTQEFETGIDGQQSFRKINIVRVEEGYKCCYCKEVVSVSDVGYSWTKDPIIAIKEHINAFHYGAYKCEECQSYQRSKKSLYQHSLRHRKVSCTICGKPDIVKRNLGAHMWTHKDPAEQQAIIDAGEYYKMPFEFRKKLKIKGLKGWRCTVCDEIFESSNSLKAHRRKSHPKKKASQGLRSSRKIKQEDNDSDSSESDQEESKTDLRPESTEDVDVKVEKSAPPSTRSKSRANAKSSLEVPPTKIETRSRSRRTAESAALTLPARKVQNPKRRKNEAHFVVECTSSEEAEDSDWDFAVPIKKESEEVEMEDEDY